VSLRIREQDVDNIVTEFNVRISQLQIPLRIFYERLPEKYGVFKRQVGTCILLTEN
jgi:hypothetical protein